MFQAEHILACSYQDLYSLPLEQTTDNETQEQLKSARILIQQLKEHLRDKAKIIQELESEIIVLKDKNGILLGQLQAKEATPQKSISLMQSAFSQPGYQATPKASYGKPLRLDSENSQSSRPKNLQTFSAFKINLSMDDDNLSQFPEWINKSLPYKRFKTLIKLFMQTIAHIIKILVKNRSYQNQQQLEVLKGNVICFVKEFNSKHEAKKTEGWEEEEQVDAISKLKGFSKEIKQLLNVTFGNSLSLTPLKSSVSKLLGETS